jgi:anti-sigma regulatory factor (Ser/Thr protein kinase)/CheY-like chemotaxis protein
MRFLSGLNLQWRFDRSWLSVVRNDNNMDLMASTQDHRATLAPKTALLIGADPEVESALSSILNPEGWRLEKASGNDDAFALAKSRFFDLIITGRHTSGREDVAFLRRIRSVRPHTRMIILADDSTPADVIASMREYAFGYLSKSFSMDSLNEIVQMALDSPAWDDGIEIVSATPQWIKLHVRCEVQAADRLLQFMREIADLDLPEDERKDVGIAFREMVLNAMEHGGQFDPTQYVEISYVRTSHMVMCRIKDPGQGFSLEEIRHAAVGNPPEDPTAHISIRNELGMRPGGFGVMLAKHLLDDLVYSEKGNEVLLVKYLSPGASPKP